MVFAEDEKALAILTAYRALVIALLESKALSPALFEKHVTMGIARLEAVGETGASNAMAEAMEPLLSDIRRVLQGGM